MTLKNRKELYAREPLLPEILEFAVAVGKVSTTSIQRRFNIGYPRAARLIDILTEEGFIEGSGGARKVLLSQEEFVNLYGGNLSKLKEEEKPHSFVPKPRKGQVKLEELNKMVFDILCKDALVNLSSEFLLDYLKKKDYKIKFVKFDFDNVSEIFRVDDKITAPVIYIVDIAKGSIIEILKQCNLLVKEGAIVMRKTNADQSKLTILF